MKEDIYEAHSSDHLYHCALFLSFALTWDKTYTQYAFVSCIGLFLGLMASSDSGLKAQAQQILDMIAFMPFEKCLPVSRRFSNISPRPGIYAVRHRENGLLYIGKTQNLRRRFAGGHKAFLWAWLDRYDALDIRISFQPIPYRQNPTLLLELEAIILRASEPPYNVLIPPER